MAHFIGDNKPWMRAPPSVSGPPGQSSLSGPYGELTSKWWSSFGKHYGVPSYQEYETAIFGTGQKNYGFLSAAKGDASERIYSPPGKYNTTQRGSSSAQSSAPQDTERSTAPNSRKAKQTEDQAGELPSVSILDDMANKHKGPESWPGGLPKRRPSARDIAFSESPAYTPFPFEIEIPIHREPLFVPIRSIEAPSRFSENFLSRSNSGSASANDTRSHFEQHKCGTVPEFVKTVEGLIPQNQYFRTGANSYYIQEFTESGVPLPVDPELVMQLTKKTINDIVADIETQTGQYQVFRAPQAVWDASRSAPQRGGAAEAPNLRIESYINQWDNPAVMTPTKNRPWYEVPAAPNPVFPWESQTRTVTRVFGDEPHSELPAVIAHRQVEELEDHSEDESTVNESVDDYNDFENKWDTDPAIRDYVYTLEHTDPSVAKAVEVPDAVPALGHFRHQSSRSQQDAPHEFDIEQKIRDIQTLPKQVLVQLLRLVLENEHGVKLPGNNYTDAGVQADEYTPSEQWEDSTVAPSSDGTEVPRKATRQKPDAEAKEADYFNLREQGMEKDKVLGWIHSKPGQDVDRVFPEDFEVGVIRPMSEFAMWTVPEA